MRVGFLRLLPSPRPQHPPPRRRTCSVAALVSSVLFLLCLLGPTAVAAATPPKCFQLTGSTVCPDLRNFYVATSSAFQDVAAFDSYLAANSIMNRTNYMSSFSQDFGCSRWNGLGQRYQISQECFYYVQNGGCAQNPNPLPASGKLCKSQCLQSVASTAAIFANTTACPAVAAAAASRIQTNRATFTRTLSAFCNMLDDTQAKCTRGLAADVSQCGFSQWDEARTYCGTADGRADPCCLLVIARASSMEIGSLSLSSSVVDPVQSLPYIASGAAVAGMLLFSVVFVACVKSRRWRTTTTTAIQPPESHMAPGPLGRTGTVVKGRHNDGDEFDRPRRQRMSLAQQFRRSVLGVRPRRTDPASQPPALLPAPQNAKMVQIESAKQQQQQRVHYNNAPQNAKMVQFDAAIQQQQQQQRVDHNNAPQYAKMVQFDAAIQQQQQQQQQQRFQQSGGGEGGGRSQPFPSLARTFRPALPPSLSRQDQNATIVRKPSYGNTPIPTILVQNPSFGPAAPARAMSPSAPAPRMMSPPPPPPPQAFTDYAAGPAPAAERHAPMVVAEAYDRQMPDEITLIVGDVVIILEAFDDGWAVGRNESTGAVGALPMSCLDPLFPHSPAPAGPNGLLNTPQSRSRPRSERKSSLFLSQ
ncbi:hypothetical protein HDU88_008206 [Geranomyces variabilis]|nr:hypothetical protein HDU88_008206 [Geranomyces variabilis]